MQYKMGVYDNLLTCDDLDRIIETVTETTHKDKGGFTICLAQLNFIKLPKKLNRHSLKFLMRSTDRKCY